jgi:hypothetical protein
MKEFDKELLELLNGMKANLYYQTNEKDDDIHFKLGDLELSVVARDNSSSWDYKRAGIVFESRGYHAEDYLDNIKYSKPIRVEINTCYRLPEGEGNCVLAFLDSETEELVAYISTRYTDDQYYCTFKGLQTAAAVQSNLQDRLLR